MAVLGTVSTEGDVLDSTPYCCNNALRIYVGLLHRFWKYPRRRPRLGYFIRANMLGIAGCSDPVLDFQSKADLFGRLFPVSGGFLPSRALVYPNLGTYLHRADFLVWPSDSFRIPSIFILWHSSAQQGGSLLLNCKYLVRQVAIDHPDPLGIIIL